jgi:hypothetical protein
MVLIAPVAIAAVRKGAEQLSWVPLTDFSRVRTFAVYITGMQGEPLLILYLLLGSIGILAGIRAWLGKTLVAKWKFTLMVCCLFLPLVLSMVISRVVTPIFDYKYLLLILPYLAVLAAIGIALVSLGWNIRMNRLINIPIGIAIVILTLTLSTVGIKSVFNSTREKDDFRRAAQFLAKNCPNSLRLYYLPWEDMSVMYYNDKLQTQVKDWSSFLDNNPNSEEIAGYLPQGYSQVCLVLVRVRTPVEKAQSQIIQSAIQINFPKLITNVTFYTYMNVEIYSR